MIQLSIIIPFYNSATYLKETLESVKLNLSQNIELLMIDDGSNDNSLEIINGVFKDKFYNVKILSRPNNKPKGANACRNYGIENAVGNYVMFIDSDDLISETCLSDRIHYINNQRTQHDLYVFQTAFISNQKNITGLFPKNIIRNNDQMLISFLKHDILWHTMSVVWNKDFLINIGKWNEKYPRLQDVELNIRALLKDPNIHITKNQDVDSYYRSIKMSDNKKEAARYGFIMIIRDYYPILINKFFNSDEDRDLIIDIFQQQLVSTLGGYLQSNVADQRWCDLYIETLALCEMETEEIENVKKLLERNNTIRDDDSSKH